MKFFNERNPKTKKFETWIVGKTGQITGPGGITPLSVWTASIKAKRDSIRTQSVTLRKKTSK